MIAGNAPRVIGRVLIDQPEMLFVQYMPVKMPGSGIRLPPNLKCFYPMVEIACMLAYPDEHVYLTAKHLHVDRDRCFNRPGWHADGYGTDDINYVWCDRAPTEFCVQPFELSDDCDESMAQMEVQAKPENIRTYGKNTLLRLDSTVVHRPPGKILPGMRTFVKVSVSRSRYNLEGNAHNYLFDYDWAMVPRSEKRNHPATQIKTAENILREDL